MPKQETYESDVDNSTIEPGDLVIVTVHRVGQAEEAKTVYVSEDQLAALFEESETLGALILSD